MADNENNDESTKEEEPWQDTLLRATTNLGIVRTCLIGLATGADLVAPDLKDGPVKGTVEGLVRLIDRIDEDLGIVLG